MSKPERKDKQSAAPAGRTGRWADYFWVNLIFWAFLGVLLGLVWVSCQDPADDEAVKYILKDTFTFIFLLFGLGFTLVTLFDAAFDFFNTRAEDSGKTGNQASVIR